jgi:hypothetical protein
MRYPVVYIIWPDIPPNPGLGRNTGSGAAQKLDNIVSFGPIARADCLYSLSLTVLADLSIARVVVDHSTITAWVGPLLRTHNEG